MPRSFQIRGAFLGAWILFISAHASSKTIVFENEIAPILQKHCVECHGEKSIKGDLDLRTLAALKQGGETGEVIVPGDAHKSSLFEKIKSGEMPPKKRTKLNSDELHLFEEWINAGASGKISPADSPSAVSAEQKLARKVFEVFEFKCLPCHSDKKQEGELDLRTVLLISKGGKSGPALVKGDAEKSLLVTKIQEDAMPPRARRNEVSIKPVTSGELDLIKKWINNGGIEPPPIPGDVEDDFKNVSTEDKQWWAFQTPRRAEIPKVKNSSQVRTPIDAFLLAKLEEKGLGFSLDAEKRRLARRAFLHVTGLPPKPKELESFLADHSPDAYEKLVDQLLASSRYGERWGQFWLDAAGYADSEGAIDDDPIWEEFWRYRDYVIRSLNADKPYDQFLTEQLAGDELTDYRNALEITSEISDKLIATGFLRGGVDPTMSSAMNFIPDRHQVLADKVEMIGSTVMGLTLHCARCHSHKYDPITQRDYYRMGAIFSAAYSPMDWKKPTERYLPLIPAAEQRDVEKFNAGVDVEKKKIEQPLEELRKKYKAQLLEKKTASLPEEIRAQLRELFEVPREKRTEAQKVLAQKYAEERKADDAELNSAFHEFKTKSEELTAAIAAVEAKKKKFDRAFGLTDLRAEAAPFYFLRRGDPFDRVHEVRPDIPAVLMEAKNPFAVKPPWTNAPTTGRRLAFARWLTHPENPLTARVIANRTWQHYFGKGIVETPENFGHTGAKPTHPELLDWLAMNFVKDGWSFKKLHRLILTSTAFRQESRASENNLALDPENELLWRMPMQRLDAEAIRDSVLSCNGVLKFDMFGPPLPIDIKPDGQVVAKNAPENFRRSIYMLHRRSKPMTMLDTFDAPQLSVNCTRRRLSNVVSQPLLMFNSEFMAEQSEHLATRVEIVSLQPDEQIEWLYQRLFIREPNSQERKMAAEFLEKQERAYGAAQPAQAKPAGREALVDLCLTLLNSAEFIYVD